MTNGSAIVPEIIIEGTFDNWPGGPQTLTELPAYQESGRDAFCFGGRLTTDGNEVWFRITYAAIRGMLVLEDTPQSRGERLVECLIAWLGDDPARISVFAVVPYGQDKSARLDFRGSDVRNPATEGDTLWVNYSTRRFSSRSMVF